MEKKQAALSGWITLALVAASLEPILVKFGYRDAITPLQLLFLKNVIGALLIVPLARKWQWLGFAGLKQMLVTGCLLFSTNCLTLISLQHLQVVLVITIVTTTPALVALTNSIIGRDQLDKKFWLGFIMCFGGVLLTLDLHDVSLNMFGVACAFGAALTSTFYRVKMEDLTARFSPTLSSIYTFLVQGTLTLAVIPFMGSLPAKAIGLGAWMGLSAALANLAFLSALNIVGSTRISILTMLQRPLVVLFAIVALHETATFVQVIGIALVMIGVQLAKVKRLASVETNRLPELQTNQAN